MRITDAIYSAKVYFGAHKRLENMPKLLFSRQTASEIGGKQHEPWSGNSKLPQQKARLTASSGLFQYRLEAELVGWTSFSIAHVKSKKS